MRRLIGYRHVEWQRWGLGAIVDTYAPVGQVAGVVYAELRLGPVTLGLAYHWWRREACGG